MTSEERFNAVKARLVKVRKAAQEQLPAAEAEFQQTATRMKGLFDRGKCNQVIEAVDGVCVEEFGTAELEGVTFSAIPAGRNPDDVIETLVSWATAAEQTLARTYGQFQKGLSADRSDPLF
jgi:hypothetical protein